MANPVSIGLNFSPLTGADATARRGAAVGAAEVAAVAGLLVAIAGPEAARGADPAGLAAAPKFVPGAVPPAGPPGGRVGSLIVGAAEGFGGRLMRTVSFLG